MGGFIALIMFLPVLIGMFVVSLGVTIVTHNCVAPHVGKGLGATFGFIAYTLAMIGCIWLLAQLRFFENGPVTAQTFEVIEEDVTQ